MRASYFDSNMKINQTKWAITLLKARSGEHAQLVVEGLTSRDEYLCKFAHFVGPMASRAGSRMGSYLLWSKEGEVKPFKVIKPGKLKFGGSKTWIVNRANAEAMMKHVDQQPKKQPFRIFGDYSYGSCGELTLIGKEYLKAMPDMALEISVEALQFFLLSALLQSSCNIVDKYAIPIALTLVSTKAIFYKTALEDQWLIYRNFFSTPRHPSPFVRTLGAPDLKQLDQIVSNISDLEMPNNCLTWAKKQLKVAGIDIYTGFLPKTSNAISNPSLSYSEP